MARRFDERLAALRAAVSDPTADGARALIINALQGKNGLLVAVATKAVVDEDRTEPDAALLQRLPPAFERLMQDPVKRDPQCQGKVAIVRCLRQAEHLGDAVFLAGVRHRQYEPVWGGRVDTAAELRGICAMALVEGHHPRAMIEAAHLLADAETSARTAAARALGVSGRPDVAEPLLRLRLEVGETELEVVGECFGALLRTAPTGSLDYVAQYLSSRDDTMAEAAALALGESRRREALAPLQEQAERTIAGERRRILLLAIAMLRTEPAWAHLLELVAEGSPGLASEALRALGAFRHDQRLYARAQQAVQARPDDGLTREFAERFDPDAG